MGRSGLLAAVAVTVIVGVTLVSGPAVGVVDLTQPRLDAAGLGQGNATVGSVEAPATARFDRGFQTESYSLEVPDARLRVETVTGHPVVSYRLAIPALGYSRTTTYVLGPADTGWVTLSFARDTLPADAVTASSYAGTLSIVLRHGDAERLLSERAVTVAVTG